MTGFPVGLEEVSKRYRPAPGQTVTALDRVSLSVEAGSVVALMGPSGSGKSTLLHLVGAMDTADEGTIRVGDRELTKLSRREQTAYRRTIGFVFQRFHLLPALTVVDNVAAPLLPRRGAAEVVPRARELLHAVGLDGKGDVVPSTLSGGEQQRVAIARALLSDPGLVLADEPTGNLDSATGAAIVDLLLRLREERDMTILVATHDRSVAERCDRVVTLEDGRVTGTVG
jgi:putative ABC transport system ATP-binding protein